LQYITGVRIPLISDVTQCNPPAPINCSSSEKTKMDGVVSRFVDTGIIEEVEHCSGEYISSIFPVPKKNRELRIILNLKSLNPFIEYEHFKMEHLNAALTLVSENCFMASIDLKDAYYSVSVHDADRKYLRFEWNDKLYQFTCLAQGISCAPRIFTKIMKPIFAYLRSNGLLSTYYLDDSLLIGKDYNSCSRNIEITKQTLINAGFILNYQKSCLLPTTCITYLGFCIDSQKMRVSLPEHKKLHILDLCGRFSSNSKFLIRDVAMFIGLLVSSLPAVQYGALFYRFLEKCKSDSLCAAHGDYDAFMVLNNDAHQDINWWSLNIMCSYRPINIEPPSITIQSDASLIGWGSHYNARTTGGHWSSTECRLHINVLELKAILFSLKSFLSEVKETHIRIQTDSSTAVCYINKLGGVKSMPCHRVTKDIWLWAIERDVHLSAEHLPGTQNVEADKASRLFDENTEWQLSRSIFEKIEIRHGKIDIDLFASRLNAQCVKYCSWKPDPQAIFIDAFSRNWKDFSNPYMFPPFSVIPACLQKICQDKARVVFVAPLWPTQVWFPKMMRMLVAIPMILPLGILNLPFKTEAVHRQHGSLRLMVCHVSGNSTESEGFRRSLSTSYVLPGEIQLNHNIKFILRSGYISVIEGIKIPCCTMK